MRFAYADPPYPGLAYKYKGHPDYAGEVDHKVLIDRLVAEYPDGWALSTLTSALRDLLPLCPADVRVLSWVKTFNSWKSVRPTYCWEPVILWRGRQKPYYPSVSDWVAEPMTTQRGLVGVKPEKVCAWIFRCLGARPGDTLDDLFPGSGAVGRAWEKYLHQLSYLDNGGEKCVSSQSTFPIARG